jgi:hypothetical protein
MAFNKTSNVGLITEKSSDLEDDFHSISHEDASKFKITDLLNIFNCFKTLTNGHAAAQPVGCRFPTPEDWV